MPETALPAAGLIASGLAAGFLYRTDSSLGMLEGFVTNPTAPARRKRDAIAAIVEALCAEAQALGISHVLGFTRSRGMGRTVSRAGLKNCGTYTLFTKVI